MSTVALLGVQKATTGNAVITTLVDVAVGDLIVIFGQGNAAITASAISDSATGGSNVYTPSIGATSGAPIITGYRSQSIAARPMPAGGTITIDNTGGKSRQSHVAVVVKNPASAPVDKTNAAIGGTASPSPGATGTLSQADEVVLVGISAIQVGDPTLAGYTKIGSVSTNGGSNDRTTIVYAKVVNATTSTTPVGGLAAAANWAASLLTAKTQADTPPAGPTAKLWNGTAEVDVTMSMWDGSAEVPITLALG